MTISEALLRRQTEVGEDVQAEVLPGPSAGGIAVSGEMVPCCRVHDGRNGCCWHTVELAVGGVRAVMPVVGVDDAMAVRLHEGELICGDVVVGIEILTWPPLALAFGRPHEHNG